MWGLHIVAAPVARPLVRLFSRPAIWLALFSSFAVPAHASGFESRYTSLANDDCKFAVQTDEEVQEDTKTCSGTAGISVVVSALGTSVQIGFGWGETGPEDVSAVVEAWSAGEKMEWRGPVVSGVFRPEAAVVRMLFPKEGTADVGHQALAVMRIEDGNACLLGAVDIAANRNGYDLARTLADKAPAFECGRDVPVSAGVETEWTRRVLDTAGNQAWGAE